jgi:hypothetical protein
MLDHLSLSARVLYVALIAPSCALNWEIFVHHVEKQVESMSLQDTLQAIIMLLNNVDEYEKLDAIPNEELRMVMLGIDELVLGAINNKGLRSSIGQSLIHLHPRIFTCFLTSLDINILYSSEQESTSSGHKIVAIKLPLLSSDESKILVDDVIEHFSSSSNLKCNNLIHDLIPYCGGCPRFLAELGQLSPTGEQDLVELFRLAHSRISNSKSYPKELGEKALQLAFTNQQLNMDDDKIAALISCGLVRNEDPDNVFSPLIAPFTIYKIVHSIQKSSVRNLLEKLFTVSLHRDSKNFEWFQALYTLAQINILDIHLTPVSILFGDPEIKSPQYEDVTVNVSQLSLSILTPEYFPPKEGFLVFVCFDFLNSYRSNVNIFFFDFLTMSTIFRV